MHPIALSAVGRLDFLTLVEQRILEKDTHVHTVSVIWFGRAGATYVMYIGQYIGLAEPAPVQINNWLEFRVFLLLDRLPS